MFYVFVKKSQYIERGRGSVGEGDGLGPLLHISIIYLEFLRVPLSFYVYTFCTLWNIEVSWMDVLEFQERVFVQFILFMNDKGGRPFSTTPKEKFAFCGMTFTTAKPLFLGAFSFLNSIYCVLKGIEYSNKNLLNSSLYLR